MRVPRRPQRARQLFENAQDLPQQLQAPLAAPLSRAQQLLPRSCQQQAPQTRLHARRHPARPARHPRALDHPRWLGACRCVARALNCLLDVGSKQKGTSTACARDVYARQRVRCTHTALRLAVGNMAKPVLLQAPVAGAAGRPAAVTTAGAPEPLFYRARARAVSRPVRPLRRGAHRLRSSSAQALQAAHNRRRGFLRCSVLATRASLLLASQHVTRLEGTHAR